MKNLLIFVAGLAVGGSVTWYMVKNYYKDIADEEVEDVKNYYYKEVDRLKEKECEDIAEDFDEPIIKPNKDSLYYKGLVDKLNYGKFSEKKQTLDTYVDEEQKAPDDGFEPYLITPEEFADGYNYDKITLTYFDGDETFMSVNDEIVPDGLGLIGEENLQHFGVYEEGVLYVRNSERGSDYEVIYNSGTYERYSTEGE